MKKSLNIKKINKEQENMTIDNQKEEKQDKKDN